MTSNDKVYYATGRRKTSSARVFLKPGTGQITVNGRAVAEHLKRRSSQMIMFQPIAALALENKFDITITVVGGGESGQAGAIRHGIARALATYDDANRPTLKKAGLLVRDSREVERKKYGLAGARRRYQYSKR